MTDLYYHLWAKGIKNLFIFTSLLNKLTILPEKINNHMQVFHGIAVYEIIFKNGKVKLNGHYTNTWLFTKPNILDIEIAWKETATNDIVGEYNCTFTQEIKPLDVTNCILIIRNFGKNAYKFEWRDTNTHKLIFNGMGLKAGNKYVAVSYTVAEEPISNS